MIKLLAFTAAPFVVTAILLSACDFQATKDSGTYAAGEVSYATVQQKVFEPSCVGCHGSHQKGGGVDLETYASAFANAAEINTTVFIDHSMPKSGSLTADQTAILQAWINSGAPEFAGTPTSNPSPTPSPISPAQALAQIRQTFDKDVRPLVKRACMECHDSHAKPTGLIGHLPIGNEIEWDHIHKASAVLDFSGTFPNWSKQESDPIFFLSEIKTVIDNGSMPIASFKIFHESDHTLLNYVEETTIVNWVDQSTQLWEVANPQPPTASQYMTSRCLGCHNSENANGGFAFGKNGDQLTVPAGKTSSGIPYLDQLDPENSALYRVLLTDPAQRKGLPQMPDGSAASAAQAALVLNWIKAGEN